MPKSKNRSPARPKSCFVDFNYDTGLDQTTCDRTQKKLLATCRQKVLPVTTGNRGGCKVLISHDGLLDDVQAIPYGQYSGIGRTQHG